MTRRLLAVGAVVAALLAGCGTGEASRAGPTPDGGGSVTTRAAATVQPAAVQVGHSVWTNVSVATLWVSPSSPRPVDAPALSRPVHIKTWLDAMSTSVRLGLVGRVETQALYGERLLVTAVQGSWLHVVAVGQPTHRDARGYPGWVPARQVTTAAPRKTDSVATVVRPLTKLLTTAGAAALWVGFGTRLPVLSVGTTRTTVATPTGGRLTVRNADVVRRARGAAPLPLTAASVMTSAYRFVGTPYLWGGRSGYAVDCSGFTNLVYGVHGVRLPRDADDQATAGTRVAIGSQRKADLLFWGSPATHVGFYAGSGQLLHAPRTGEDVTSVPLSSRSRPSGVRRFT